SRLLGFAPEGWRAQRTRALQLRWGHAPRGNLVPRPSSQLALVCPPAGVTTEPLWSPASPPRRERALAPGADRSGAGAAGEMVLRCGRRGSVGLCGVLHCINSKSRESTPPTGTRTQWTRGGRSRRCRKPSKSAVVDAVDPVARETISENWVDNRKYRPSASCASNL